MRAPRPFVPLSPRGLRPLVAAAFLVGLVVVIPAASAIDAGLGIAVDPSDPAATGIHASVNRAPVALPVELEAGFLPGILPRVAVDTGAEGPAAAPKSPEGASSGESLVRPVTEAAAEAAPAAFLVASLAWLTFGLEPLRAAAGAAMYSRLKRDELLDNPARRAVYEHVKANPGATLTATMDAAGLGWGTTVYHLQRLHKAQFVVADRVAGGRRFWVQGATTAPERHAAGALVHGTAQAVHALVEARPGIAQEDVCAALDLTASAASKNLAKLARAGLVTRVKDGRRVRYHAKSLEAVAANGAMHRAPSAAAG